MTKRSEMTVSQADNRAAEHGIIAKVSGLGGTLIFYTGNIDQPGSWLEIGKVAIRNGNVSIKAVDMLLR